MTYSAEISRTNPSCFLFILDQSGSMGELMPGRNEKKSEFLAKALNKLIQNLVLRSAKADGVRDYFYVGAIGYGKNDDVYSAFGGDLAGRELVPISELAKNPLEVREIEQQVEDGAGGLATRRVKLPVWILPEAGHTTPMQKSFDIANKIIANWLSQNPNSYPPVVIHVTDGMWTDGDPSDKMQALMGQSSTDGSALLFNLHVSSAPALSEIIFPDDAASLPDEYAEMLFNNSSTLIPQMVKVAMHDYGVEASLKSRAFMFNADGASIIKALEIGTIGSKNLDRNTNTPLLN